MLGSGASAHAYLARRRGGPAEPIVIKILNPAVAEEPELVKRFRHEAELAVALHSPHIARVHEAGRVGEQLYLCMEWVPGWTVARVIKALFQARRTVPLPFVLHLARHGAQALHDLHTARDPQTGEPLGIVHRDLSPRNLMLEPSGRLRMIDLGLGKSNLQDWKTRSGVVMGSPGFMAPEQVRGETVCRQTDQYAFACVLYELLTLKPCIPRSGSRAEVLMRMAEPTFTPPRAHRPDLPAAVDAVFLKALAPLPEDRFPEDLAFGRALIEAAGQGSADTFVQELRLLLDPELQEEKTRVERLMRVPDRSPPFEGPATRVIAAAADSPTRVRTSQLDLVSSNPTAKRDAPMEPSWRGRTERSRAPEGVLPTRVDGPRGEAPTRVVGDEAEPTQVATTSEPFSSREVGWNTMSSPATVTPVRGWVPLVLAALGLVVVSGTVGFVAGGYLSAPEPQAPLLPAAPEPRLPASPSVSPRPAPSAAPMAPAAPGPEDGLPADSPASAGAGMEPASPSRPPRRRTPRREAADPAPPAAPSDPAEDLAQRVRRLSVRASRLRRERPEQAAAIDPLMSELTMGAASGDPAETERVLRQVSRRLAEIEAR